MSQTTRGIVCIMLSAILFGLMPVLVKLTCENGSNGLNASFLRTLICLPIIYAILRMRGIPAGFARNHWKSLFWAFGVGGAGTTTLLYLSYAYVPVGVATSLHFVYPAAVTLAYVIFFKARPQISMWVALAACMTGILILEGKTSDSGANLTGVILALASGLACAVYFIGIDKTGLKFTSPHKLLFALCCVSTLCTGALGLLTGQITFDLTATAWTYTIILAVTTTFGAAGLLQRGIQLTDGTTAAILSTFEPITSFMFAAVILGEAVTATQIISCGFILLSVVILTRTKLSSK